MKKNIAIKILIISLISTLLISCKGDDEDVIKRVPDGFVLLGEVVKMHDDVLMYMFWDNLIAFNDKDYIHIYQTSLNNSDFIIKFEGKYYVEKIKFNRIVEIAKISSEKHLITYSVGEVIEIQGFEGKTHNLVINNVQRTELDDFIRYVVSFDISPAVSEYEATCIFYIAEGLNGEYDKISDFPDLNTFNVDMHRDEKLVAITIKDLEYPGLTYRVVVD